MALIKCNECGNQISDQAEKCPVCGKPLNEKIVTVQLTSKRWKLVRLIATIGIFVGGYMFIYNIQHGGWQNVKTGMGFCLLFFSLIARYVGKIGSWWTNK